MSNWVFADKIVEHWKKNINMIEALVYADSKQSGKSVYSLKTGFNVYNQILSDNVDKYEVWDVVFKYFYTDLDEMNRDLLHFAKCKRLANKKDKDKEDSKIPYVVFDDAGVGAGSGLYQKDREKYFDLDRVLQVLGEIVQCFVMTSTNVNTPTDMLSEDRNCTIKIVKMGDKDRVAKIFADDTLPWGKTHSDKVMEDPFNVMLEDEIYKRYDIDRLNLTIECLEAVVDESIEPEKKNLPFSRVGF